MELRSYSKKAQQEGQNRHNWRLRHRSIRQLRAAREHGDRLRSQRDSAPWRCLLRWHSRRVLKQRGQFHQEVEAEDQEGDTLL